MTAPDPVDEEHALEQLLERLRLEHGVPGVPPPPPDAPPPPAHWSEIGDDGGDGP